MQLPTWTARDWRQFIAIIFLAIANLPLSAAFGWAQYTVYLDPQNHFAFWLGIAAGALMAVDIIGLSAILGRRTFRFKVGDNEMEASGEDAERIMEKAE